MSFFDKLKKLINSDDSNNNKNTIDRSSSSSNSNNNNNNNNSNNKKPNEYEKNIFINGLTGNRNVLCITFDNVLNLCACGFNDGTFKIFGKNGYEIPVKSHSGSPIKKLIFITNTPYIIAITNTSIEKWDYSMQKLNNILIYKNRITAIYFSTGLKQLFFSTEDSIIQIYNVYTNFLSSHQIFLTKDHQIAQIETPPQLDTKTTSIFPSCIKICPSNPNLMLVGYSNGLILVWNIELKRIEKRYEQFIENGYCTSISWSRKGTKYVCGFLNGEIYLVNYSKGSQILLYKTIVSDDQSSPSNNIKPIDGLEILYTQSLGNASSSSTSQSSLLPSRKFILFRGTYQGDNKSLMIIKGDNLKNQSHLSTIQVASNVQSFHPITSLPWYNNNGNLLSILTISQKDNMIYEYKLDPKTFFFSYIPLNHINLKSFKSITDITSMKSYQCDSNTIQLISQLIQSEPMPHSLVNGGSPILDYQKQSALPPKSCQLLITSEKSNQIRFWNSTDPKNLIYLGCLNINNNLNLNNNTQNDIGEDFDNSINSPNNNSNDLLKYHIATFNFCPSTLLFTVSINNIINKDCSILVYHISDFSKRIQPTILNLNEATPQQQLQQPQQPQQQESQELQQPSVDQQPSSIPSPLPNPVFDTFKFMGEIKLNNNETVTSITTNSYKTSYSTRLLFGTTCSKVYHLIIIIKNNKLGNDGNDGQPIPSSQIVYSLSIINLGSTDKLTPTMNNLQQQQQQQQTPSISQQEDKNEELSSITYISFCFYPIRENDIDSSIVYLGDSLGYVYVIDLQTMKVLTIFKQNNSSSIESIQFFNKKGEPINYLFFGSIYHDDAEDNDNLIEFSKLSTQPSNPSEEFKSMLDDILVLVSSRIEISLYQVTFNQNKVIQNKRISKNEYRNHPLIDQGSYITTLPNDSKYVLMTLDTRGQIEILNPINLDKIQSFSIHSILNNNQPNILISSQSLIFKFTVSLNNCNSFIYLYNPQLLNQNQNQNNQQLNEPILYCICLNKNELNQFPSLFVDNVPMPPEIKKQSVFSKLFSSSITPQEQIQVLDDKFNQEGVNIPNPYINNNNNINNATLANRQAMEVSDILQQAKQQMLERGDKINEIAEKSHEMENAAKNFAELTRKLAKK